MCVSYYARVQLCLVFYNAIQDVDSSCNLRCTDVESSYAIVELELAAMEWTIRKCLLSLSGLPDFTLVVDHQALLVIPDKYTLDTIENPKIQRLKERLASYLFHTVWRKGKDHAIQDALSRAPVNDPGKDDECVGEELAYSIKGVVIHRVSAICGLIDESPRQDHLPDIMLRELRTAMEADHHYKDVALWTQDLEAPKLTLWIT